MRKRMTVILFLKTSHNKTLLLLYLFFVCYIQINWGLAVV